jgi:hypothetical protein
MLAERRTSHPDGISFTDSLARLTRVDAVGHDLCDLGPEFCSDFIECGSAALIIRGVVQKAADGLNLLAAGGKDAARDTQGVGDVGDTLRFLDR